MQSLSVTLQSHLPTLAGAGHQPTLPPLAHPPRTWHSQADGAPQNFWYERVPKSAFSQYQYRMGTFLLGRMSANEVFLGAVRFR